MKSPLRTCFLPLAIVACFAAAYDFDDADYNQLLASEWEELEATSGRLTRSRRDEEATTSQDKCKRRRPKFCCADDVLEAIHEQDKPIKRECFKQVTGKERPSTGGYHGTDPFKCDKEKVDRHRREIMCVMQCVGQKKELLDKDGNLIEDNVRKQVKQKFSSEQWLTPLLDNLLNKCIEESKKVTAKSTGDEVEKDKCNEAGMRFGHCFWKELQLSCPQDTIKDQKACDRVRERLNNHPDFSFLPHRHGHDDD